MFLFAPLIAAPIRKRVFRYIDRSFLCDARQGDYRRKN
jgi:hypothetical protein